MASCWNDARGNGTSLCPDFLGWTFIYLFVHLFTFLGWMLEVVKPAGRATLSDYGLRVDAGRSGNQRWDLGAGRLRGLPVRLGSGRSNRGQRKIPAFVCKKEVGYRAPQHANARQPGLNRVISSSDDFGRAVFLIYYTTSSSSQTPSLQEDQCPQRILFLRWLGAAKKVTMNLIKDDFSVLSLRRTSAKTRHQVALKGLLWAQRMRCRCTSKHIPALGIPCQSGHLGCTVTNQDKQDHQRCYL